ncbi:MAG: alpha/beta hydrolase [Deltaproteobacteria bacterium]|nr:alpha/beta hydrolase [Deltaproteobacteria bacterium]
MRNSSLAALTAAAALCLACTAPTERRDVVYDDRYGLDTSMNIFLPAGSDTGLPAVVLIHGGGWWFGDKNGMDGPARRLARSGWVTASVDYRLVPDGAFPKDFQDCQCAIAFLRAHAEEYRLDPNRIAVLGYSAGGHLASLLGVASDHPELMTDCQAAGAKPVARPASVIDGAGPTDMRMFGDVRAVVTYMGGTAAENPHGYDLASPIYHVRPGEPPFLIIHGQSDWIVALDAASRMRDALAGAGNDVRILLLAGGGHVLNPSVDPGDLEVSLATDSPEAWIAIDDFLVRTIGAP